MEVNDNYVDKVILVENYDDDLMLKKLNNRGFTSKEFLKMSPISIENLKDDIIYINSKERIEEALILRDLFFILFGKEGIYIRFRRIDSQNPFQMDRNIDLKFKKTIDKVCKISQMVIYFNEKIEEFSNINNYGKIINSFNEFLINFFKNEYYKFLTQKIEPRFNENNLTIRLLDQLIDETNLIKKFDCLFVICDKIDKENKERNNIINSDDAYMNEQNNNSWIYDYDINKFIKGPNLLNIIENLLQLNMGDIRAKNFFIEILNSIGKEYNKMLQDWLINGQINDQFNEFFIINTMKNCKKLLYNGTITNDRIWDTQFVVSKDLLIKKISDNDGLLHQIITTGKLINIIKICYDIEVLDDNFQNENMLEECSKIIDPDLTNLDCFVEKCYERANNYFIKMLIEDYDISNYINKLYYHFLLLNNSDNLYKFVNKYIQLLSHRVRNGHENKDFYIVSERDIIQDTWKDYIDNQIILENNKNNNNRGADDDLVLPLMNLQIDELTYNDNVVRYLQGVSDISNESLPQTPVSDISFINNNNNNESSFTDRNISANNFETHIPKSLLHSHALAHHIMWNITVPFPISIIVTRPVILQLQLLSRLLLLLNYHNAILDRTSEVLRSRYSDDKLLRNAHSKLSQMIREHDYKVTTVLVQASKIVKNFADSSFVEHSTVDGLRAELLNSLVNTMFGATQLNNSSPSNNGTIMTTSKVLELASAFCRAILPSQNDDSNYPEEPSREQVAVACHVLNV